MFSGANADEIYALNPINIEVLSLKNNETQKSSCGYTFMLILTLYKERSYLEKKSFNKLSSSSTFVATSVSWFCTLFSTLSTAVA